MDESKGKRAGRATKGAAGRPKGEESSPTAAPDDMWREIIAQRLAYNSYRGERRANVAHDVVSEIGSAAKRAQLDDDGAKALDFLARLAYDVIANGHSKDVASLSKQWDGRLRRRWLRFVQQHCAHLETAAAEIRDDILIQYAERLQRDLASVDGHAHSLKASWMVERMNDFIAGRMERTFPALAASFADGCGAFEHTTPLKAGVKSRSRESKLKKAFKNLPDE